MSNCSGWHQETHNEKCVREYKMALEVMKSLKAEGKLDDICRVSAVQLPLFKNIACMIYSNQDIQLGYGKPTTKKLEGHIQVKI